METINNLTSAASKAIWGEGQSHEEPVSGKMGNVAAGEPYDAGNIGGKFNHRQHPTTWHILTGFTEWNPRIQSLRLSNQASH